MRQRRALLLAVFAAITPAVVAQKYTANTIVFNHPGIFSQAQLETAAGMHPGTQFTPDDLGAAAQRLVDTGFFENVGATLEGKVDAAKVLFDIKPIEQTQMLHVGFENFVWLSHAEIEAALQAKAPLFQDYLPENSPLGDIFKAALVEALAQKGVAAKVSHDSVEPTMMRPERTIEFRVDSPTISVANLKLSGVAPSLAPILQKSVNAIARTRYNEGLDGQTTADRILAPLYDAGYVRASLSSISLSPSVEGDVAKVILSGVLDAGDIYHVSNLTFAGAPLLSADTFAATQKLHPGDVASRALLMESLTPIDAAYRRQGYMDVIVEAVPTVDDAAHEVAYSVRVTPGEQYRIHQVTARNLDAAAKADFDRGFLMKTGELYSPEYVQTFVIRNTALRNLAAYSGSYKAYADPATHTVDLIIDFVR